MINRFSARLDIVQALFEADVRRVQVLDIIKEWQITREQATENTYFSQVLEQFTQGVTTFDTYFMPLLSSSHGVQDPVILAILRGACAELIGLKAEVPWRVVLNEYTNITKRFSDYAGDASFVNALLDKVVSGQAMGGKDPSLGSPGVSSGSVGCVMMWVGLSLLGMIYPLKGWAAGKKPFVSYKTSLFVPMKPVCISIIGDTGPSAKPWCKTLILEVKHSTDLPTIHRNLPVFRDMVVRDLWGRLHLVYEAQHTALPSMTQLKQRLMTLSQKAFGAHKVIDILIEPS